MTDGAPTPSSALNGFPFGPSNCSVNCLDVDAELKALKQRKAKLIRLRKVRNEVRALEETMTSTDPKLAMRIISEEVCQKFNLSFDMLQAQTREEAVCKPRQLAFYLGHELKGIPYNRIAMIFGKDHGTVMAGCRRTRDRMDTEKGFSEIVSDLVARCKARLDSSPNAPGERPGKEARELKP